MGGSGSKAAPRRNGKLAIPLTFEDALRAATEVPADKLPPPAELDAPRKKAKR